MKTQLGYCKTLARTMLSIAVLGIAPTSAFAALVTNGAALNGIAGNGISQQGTSPNGWSTGSSRNGCSNGNTLTLRMFDPESGRCEIGLSPDVRREECVESGTMPCPLSLVGQPRSFDTDKVRVVAISLAPAN